MKGMNTSAKLRSKRKADGAAEDKEGDISKSTSKLAQILKQKNRNGQNKTILRKMTSWSGSRRRRRMEMKKKIDVGVWRLCANMVKFTTERARVLSEEENQNL